MSAVPKSVGPSIERESGFILIVVLWTAALLALFAAALAASTDNFVRTTRNSIERSRLELLAGAGIRLGLRDLMSTDARPEVARFAAGGPAVTCQLPDGETLRLNIEDEAGKVDLNSASDDLLRALMQGAGLPSQQAASLVDAIADWRDSDDSKRPNGAELAEYLAAGQISGPKNAPFDSSIELGGVLGVSRGLLAKLRPHLTVHSGVAGVDPRHASAGLLQLLVPGEAAPTSHDDFARQLPPRFLAASQRQAFTLRADVWATNGGHFGLAAIASRQERATSTGRRNGNSQPLPENASRARPTSGLRSDQSQQATGPSFRVWQWERAEGPDGDKLPSETIANLGPC